METWSHSPTGARTIGCDYVTFIVIDVNETRRYGSVHLGVLIVD